MHQRFAPQNCMGYGNALISTYLIAAHCSWLNFPRCDDSDNSLGMCRSVCENFMRACKVPTDMWRCYEPRYFGGERLISNYFYRKAGKLKLLLFVSG